VTFESEPAPATDPAERWTPSWWRLPLGFIVGLAVWFGLSALLSDDIGWGTLVQGVLVMAVVTAFLAWQFYRRK
jgi:hypothetical protein